ncbi:methyl-accepting chemotaxis protein [Halotia branconii]|uniref:Methyl-accepting chemotaxis protein n=1 Tax=Halotia branconii CENA392 TaxID=1539056 RepID=A0AAJ6PAJ8_9CYAN|nr:methyl-accepting chemotaxis protein [Halotia branconii]WGV26865.1 methyl-accepting chemotaxis protein [Halotia branconii CENA392]
MAASIDDYLETYKQACAAYAQQKYEVAANLVDQVVQNVPDDPNCHLLRGHIYYVLQQYDVAQKEYQKVLQLTDDQEIIGFANNGLENISQYQQPFEGHFSTEDNSEEKSTNSSRIADNLESNEPELQDLGIFADSDSNNSFDLNCFNPEPETVDLEEISSSSPFDIPTDSISFNTNSDSSVPLSDDPFALNQNLDEPESNANIWEKQSDLELPAFWQEDSLEESLEEPKFNSNFLDSNASSDSKDYSNNSNDSPFGEFNSSTSNSLENTFEVLVEENQQDSDIPSLDLPINSLEGETLLMGKAEPDDGSTQKYSSQDNLSQSKSSNWLQQSKAQENFPETLSSVNGNFALPNQQQLPKNITVEPNSFDSDEGFDFEAFESAFGSEEFSLDDNRNNNILNGEKSKSNIEFLDDFDEFDDLGSIPGFDLAEVDSSFGDVVMLSGTMETGSPRAQTKDATPENETGDRDDELFSITGSHTGAQEAVPVFTQTDVSKLEPTVSVEQGWLAPLENAPLDTKPWFVAGTVGVFSALVVATVSFASANFSLPQQRESIRNTGWAMSLAAGIAGFSTAAFMGSLTLRQIRRTTKDLQAQFDAVRQGNLNVQATVYSEDELGLLATGFNEMARVIFTTTHEAQRKADEQEEAKENLQRQVIRLLDDVEGAARGDLTVQAEVTADVLGAVADAFNLTIQNLRDIVQQVKVAAKEVTKGATNSETFARALSSDALRQAEELGVTLNSVQVMTDSIQRVAEAAREAEAVARDASTIALKGGEAVENTVAGILEIRETVAETTRKVKRLAESSQEISKIVALISQIASRTNLLALNASIEAARAGEAGRGFAIVADEVRQLADKSAKSLKEIEQIVMQIQSETGSVMTAMEEGTQQVIKGTKLAEEAKRSLENIIQVANRIDTLVRSITSDTVEQTETSRAVAHVMQSVELTAQETSQEAQRVSGALQNLVGVSRDLISSVERFRVETLESR